jgi:hypothetical protein
VGSLVQNVRDYLKYMPVGGVKFHLTHFEKIDGKTITPDQADAIIREAENNALTESMTAVAGPIASAQTVVSPNKRPGRNVIADTAADTTTVVIPTERPVAEESLDDIFAPVEGTQNCAKKTRASIPAATPKSPNQMTEPELGFFQSIAIPLAKQGRKLIPVNGKVAFFSNHPAEATIDIQKITKEWAQYRDCNVATHCLQESGGIAVLDDDGVADLAAVYAAETSEPAPITRRVVNRPIEQGKPFRSHWIFEQTPETIALSKNIVEGDTNGEFSLRVKNYYVVGEGSRHPEHGGIYHAVADVPVVPMPSQFLKWLVDRANKYSKTGDFTKKPEGWINEPIVHHDINNRLTAICGYYIQNNNINDPEALTDILIGHAERQAVHTDGVTPFKCNLEEIKQIVRGCASRYKTGEQKRKEQTPGLPAGTPLTAPPGDDYQWVAPEPYESSILPVQALTLDLLPVGIRSWVKDVSERMSVPLDFAGICALTALFGVTCRRAFVYPKEHDKEWKEALAVSGAVVAYSGKTKTPTWKTFTNTLVEIDRRWVEKYEMETAVYNQDLEKWEKRSNDYETAVKKATRTKTVSDDELKRIAVESGVGSRPEEPEPCRRLIINDATPEKLHEVMMDNPAGLFVYRDEMSSWVAQLDQQGRESERGLTLAAMNGNDAYGIDRIGRGTVFAVMSACYFGGFQPDILVEFLADTRNKADGLVARFGLLIYPDCPDMPIIDRRPDNDAKDRFHYVVHTLAIMPAESIGMHFTPEAQLRWNSWFESFVRRVSREEDTARQSHLAKYKGLLPKLAGLFQLIDIISAGNKPGRNSRIDLEHLNLAIKWLDYLESHMTRIYACVRTPEEKALDALVGHILRGDMRQGFTSRDIIRKRWEGLLGKDVVETALQTLFEMGWAVSAVKSSPKGGQPAPRWYLNPAVKEFRKPRH